MSILQTNISLKNIRIKFSRDALLLTVSFGILAVLVALAAWILYSLAGDMSTLFREESAPAPRGGFDLEAAKRLEQVFPPLFPE